MAMDDTPALELYRQAYRDVYRPCFESWRSRVDPSRLPVVAALLDAYIEHGDKFLREPDESLVNDLVELGSWLVGDKEVSEEEAHSGPLSGMLRDVGCSDLEAHEILARERKRKKGRPCEASLAIEGLELQLSGKTHNEIANYLLGRIPAEYSTDKLPDEIQRRKDRIRKLIESVKPVYQKYSRK
jgi:hypothetical protein